MLLCETDFSLRWMVEYERREGMDSDRPEGLTLVVE